MLMAANKSEIVVFHRLIVATYTIYLCLGVCQADAFAEPISVTSLRGDDYRNLENFKNTTEIPAEVFAKVERFKPTNFIEVSGKISKVVMLSESRIIGRTAKGTVTIESIPKSPGYFLYQSALSNSLAETRAISFMNFTAISSRFSGGGSWNHYITDVTYPDDFASSLQAGANWTRERIEEELTSTSTIFLTNGRRGNTNFVTESCSNGAGLSASTLNDKLVGEMIPVHCEPRTKEKEEVSESERDFSDYVYLREYGIFLQLSLQSFVQMPTKTADGVRSVRTKMVRNYSVQSVEFTSAP